MSVGKVINTSGLIHLYVRGNVLTLRTKQVRTQNYHRIHDMCAPANFVLTTVRMLVNQSHCKLTSMCSLSVIITRLC